MLVPGGQETCSMNFYKLWSWRSMSTSRWKDFEVRLFILFGPLGLHDYILGLFLFFLPSPSPHIPVKESKKIFKADTHKDKKENRKTDRNTDRQTERQEQSQRPIRRNSPLAPLLALLLQAECLPPHVVQLILILAPGLPAVMIPTVSYRGHGRLLIQDFFKDVVVQRSAYVRSWGFGPQLEKEPQCFLALASWIIEILSSMDITVWDDKMWQSGQVRDYRTLDSRNG